MTKHLEPQFIGYMVACYGIGWELELPSHVAGEVQQAFYMGAEAHQRLAICQSFLVGDEGNRKFAFEIQDELAIFSRRRISGLFAELFALRDRA